MPHPLEAFMFSRSVRIVMAACGKTGDDLAVLGICGAVGVLVNMKTVQARRQAGELRGEDQPIRPFGYHNCADALADPLFVGQIHRNRRVGGECRGRCDESRNDRGK